MDAKDDDGRDFAAEDKRRSKMRNTRTLIGLLAVKTATCVFADHSSELAAFRASTPEVAAKYESLIPTFPALEVLRKEENRGNVLAALDSILRKATDDAQKAEVERQIRNWRSLLSVEIETARDLQKLVGPEEWLFVFRYADGTEVQSGYLTIASGRIVQRHVMVEGEDYGRGWSEEGSAVAPEARPCFSRP